jgi:hypothetical protein
MANRLWRKWTSAVTGALVTLLFLLTTTRFAGATIVGEYQTSTSTTTYTAITGGNVAIASTDGNTGTGVLNDTATSGTLAIGFDFIFAGQHFTTLSVNTGGLIIFGSGLSGSFADDLTAAPAYPVLAPFWQHQHLYNGGAGCTITPPVGVNWLLSGTAPNREFVMEWNAQGWFGAPVYTGCDTPMFRVQARLREGTNAIDFIYGPLFTSGGLQTSASIGLARSGTDFLSVTPSGGTSMTTSAVTANDNIQLDQTPITSGTVYTFTPCFLLVNGDTGQGGTTTMNDGEAILTNVSVLVPGSTTRAPLTLAHPNALCATRNYTFAITGASAAEYVFQSSGNQALAGSLAVGETLTPVIAFTPAGAGIRTASLVVTDTTGSLVHTYTLAAAGQTTSTTALVSSANPAYPGQPVTFTATVTGASPGAAVATGNVVFRVGSTVLATVALDASGQAAFMTSSLAEGSYSITAEYAGDPYFQASTSAPVAQVVQKFASTVSVASSQNPSFVSQTVIFTASVTVPVGAPVPTGTVNFMDGPDLLATVALNSSGQAVYANNSFISANHAIRVVYGGDGATTAGTSPVLNQLVYRNVPTAMGASSPNPSLVGQPVTFTVVIAGGAGAPVPTGSVTFTADTGPIGIVALDGAGQAVLVTSTLPAGARTVTVTYPGTIVFANASTNIAHTVDKNPAEVSLVSSNNPSLAGRPVTLTTTVRGSAVGAPAGTGAVIFREGSTVLQMGALDANGQAAFTTSSLAVGSHAITVEYAGDGYYSAGVSVAVAQVVTSAGASVALVTSANPSPYGQSVTFTATATGSSVTPTGTMTVRDGTTLLGTATLNGSGVATYSTTTLAPGTHTISAEYSGDGVYAAGATGTVSQVIDRAATATALVVSTPSTTSETSITWTATVTSTATGTIGGTVTFNEGLTVIGTGTLGAGGVATTSAALPVGTHDVTATFGGDTYFASSTSSPVTTVVTQPEGGIDAGPDASADTGAVDVTFDRVDAPPRVDVARADADAGSPIADARQDTAVPPRSDVAIDVIVVTPDAGAADRTTPPADTRVDGLATSDVRSDVRADGGVDTPPGDDNGCSCRIGRRSNAQAGIAFASALVAFTLLRSRRRRVERGIKARDE